MKRILSVLAALALTGCASVTRGVNNDVSIQYEPSDAKVVTTLNHACSASPCVVKVPRKSSFFVTASKEGYVTQSVEVKTRLAGAGAAGFAGNVLIGGVVGMGVDAATGATLEHYPNPVIIVLEPENGQTIVVPGAPQSMPSKPPNQSTPVS